ncbi:MAG: SfiI family type II restriction endonuclease [Candidatus Hydrogenedentes bacterium]|nr:SfiI family type II restriction endonuclease [Candidatus Hydrogenedentota bacterium]
MSQLQDPTKLSLDEIEAIEKQSLRWLFQAASDFGFEAWEIFHQSQDDVKDIAEDITREMLDRLGGYQIPRRILGNVDYRKARYIILPEFAIRQALFVDSKAEQLSMEVRQRRAGEEIRVKGPIPEIHVYDGSSYLTTILLVHYEYRDAGGQHLLRQMTLAALPNGLLQDRHNPTPDDLIWKAGPNAPSRGEAFRVRLSFPTLMAKSAWRVQQIVYNQDGTISAAWSDSVREVAEIDGEENGQV